MFILFSLRDVDVFELPANGLRYLLAGGTRERAFNGTALSQENCLKTRRIPASQVHAVLGA